MFKYNCVLAPKIEIVFFASLVIETRLQGNYSNNIHLFQIVLRQEICQFQKRVEEGDGPRLLSAKIIARDNKFCVVPEAKHVNWVKFDVPIDILVGLKKSTDCTPSITIARSIIWIKQPDQHP